jgi:hypothetical protein
LAEGEAGCQGVLVRVARLPMDSVLGAQATDQRQGFMKALVGDRDDRILAMLAGLSYSNLADADYAHPTMAEGLKLIVFERAATFAEIDL